MKILNKVLGAAALILASAMPLAQADVVYEFTNPNRTADSPDLGFANDFVFAKATFALDPNNAGDLLMTLWVAPEMDLKIVTAWYFNIIPQTVLDESDFSHVSGVSSWTAQTINGSCTPCTADGTGEYDFKIDFSSGELAAGLQSVISINASTALTLDMFESALSDPDGFGAAIHVQRIGLDQEDSGWYTANCVVDPTTQTCSEDPGGPGGNPTPEPGTLALIGLGFAAMAYRRRQR
ncbi:MAG TPA: PEP-CTERM sorting domain-containing protein [Pseudoduganella sp.]